MSIHIMHRTGRKDAMKDQNLMMRVSADWLAVIDEWRHAQLDDRPSRSEAVRRLVERGLESKGAGVPFRHLPIDGRSATVVQLWRTEVTVFADGEVRITTKRRGK
jgi:hypothetical protein